MNEVNIEYKIQRVYGGNDSVVIESTNAWYGHLTFTKEAFNELGRPTVGDELIMNVRLSNQTTKEMNK